MKTNGTAIPVRRTLLRGAAALATTLTVLMSQSAWAQEAPSGQEVYQGNRCITCHGANGQGTIGPALAGNEALDDLDQVLHQIINGEGRMPSYGDQLSDAEIAAVASHVRTHFGNEFGEVTLEDVERFRADGSAAAND